MDDFILNGIANGSVASRLLACNMNPLAMRPYVGDDGRSYITVMEAGKAKAIPITNTIATLRKDDWKTLDDAILKTAKSRLRVVADLRGAGLQYTIPNGMGKTVLETERMGDINDAQISMDALRQAANDRPEFELINLPLPIVHKEYSFSLRQIAASRNGGSPLDTTMAEAAGRKVAEEVEKLTLGVLDTYTYGGGTIYGLTNFTSRLTYVLTAPTASGWTAETLLTQLLAMRQSSQDAKYYGPWMLYNAPAWDAYLDEDYKAASDITLRERIKKVSGFQDLRTADYLENYDIVMVQMTSDVIRMVIGMELNSVQWEVEGGMLQKFKVMTIQVPQVRCDFNSNTGLVHGATA